MYFNYQVLLKGNNFNLPNNDAFLNCNMLHKTAYLEQKRFAKIVCNLKNNAMTSTKLQLLVFTDKPCSVSHNDGQSDNAHANNGYIINGYSFTTKVSFHPALYLCQYCSPAQISNSFSKSETAWYEDDYISKNEKKQSFDDDDEADTDADVDNFFAASDNFPKYMTLVPPTNNPTSSPTRKPTLPNHQQKHILKHQLLCQYLHLLIHLLRH
eukprot:1262051-Ditylum_brightwellii.AAC.1